MNEPQDFKPTTVHKQTLTCFDSDHLRDVIKGADFDIHQVAKGSFHSEMFLSSLGKGILNSARYTNSILTNGTLSQEYMTVGMIHDCQEEAVFNGNTLKKHDILLGNEGGPLISCLSPNTYWSSFQFRREDLLKTGLTLDKDNNKIYRSDIHMQKNLSIQLESILKYLENSQESSSLNGEMLYNHILSIYAKALDHSKDIIHVKRSECVIIAKQIYHYLQEQASEPIQMIHLTQLTGKSERTVERIFKKHFGISPYRYLKLHRLHLIRSKLKQGNPSTPNITHLAMENGFMQMGYFGSEYKKLFNETPSQTRRR